MLEQIPFRVEMAPRNSRTIVHDDKLGDFLTSIIHRDPALFALFVEALRLDLEKHPVERPGGLDYMILDLKRRQGEPLILESQV